MAAAILLTGCSRNLSGVYTIPGLSPDHLGYTFNNDSTFCLKSWSDIVGEDEICGKWKINKDTIWLFRNSDTTKNKSNPVVGFSESHTDSSKIKIVIRDTHNQPISGVSLVLNSDSRKYLTGKDGIFEASYQKIDKLEIEYIGIGKHSFIPQASSNEFFIKFDFDTVKLEKLKLPEKLLWRGDAIYDLSKNKVISGYSFHKISRKDKRRN